MKAKSTVRDATRTGVHAVAKAFDRVKPPPLGLTVLSYHQVGGPQPRSVNISLPAFEDQIAGLAERTAGRVVGLSEGIEMITTKPAEPAPLVSVTFDDGTADFVDHALDVLVRHRIPVTLYLATAFVEEGRSFWDDDTVLTWSALKDALSTGLVTIGTHTHSHALLDRAGESTTIDELERSMRLVEDHLDVTPEHFAYPKALAPVEGSPADRAVRARVASAAVAGGRVNRYGSTDRWLVSRTPIVAADDASAFVRKACGGLRLEGELRERADKWRYRKSVR